MTAVRRALDALYLASGLAGALALAAIAIIIGLQVVGRQFGATLPGADDLTAFAVAGSAMLPLAYAFRHGAHIRVDLIIGRLSGKPRFLMEALALLIATLLCAWFAWSMADLASDSFAFEDVAQGTVPWKLWVPQAMVAAGVAIFAVSLLDDLLVHLSGGVPSYRAAADKAAIDRAAEEL
jgi:TRAP-type C4-dicarboxylate transport system permease small subunit